MASDRNDFRPPLYMSLPNQRYKLITASKTIKCLYEHAFEGLVIFTITKKRPWFVCISETFDFLQLVPAYFCYLTQNLKHFMEELCVRSSPQGFWEVHSVRSERTLSS